MLGIEERLLLARLKGSIWNAEEPVDLCDLEASADLIDFPRSPSGLALTSR
jgi:hypothetical protein